MYEFKNELRKLKELTNELVCNGYLTDQAGQWEAALDAIPEIIFIINPDFDIKFVNKKFAEKMCVEKNSLINRKCFHIITCCNEEGTCLCEENQLEPVYLGDIEITSGLTGWFSYTRSPIYNGENELLGFICVLVDVTERKKVEKELDENVALMKSIFKTVPAGIGLVKDSVLKWSNAKLREITGYSEEELEGKSCRILYPDDNEHEWVRETINNQMIDTGNSNIDTVWKRKNGKIIRVLLSASPIDRMDWSKGITFAATDITTYDE